MNKSTYWTLCKVAVGILLVLSLSPLVIPAGVHEPDFNGIPYTLWVGILDAFLLVALTWLGTRVHPGRGE